MGDDLVDVSLGAGPLSVSVGGLIRRLFSRPGPAAAVPKRFLELFGAHGVSVPQIQRLLPEVRLDQLSDQKALLGALTNEVLDKTAELLGVQRSWLDGGTDRIYAPVCWYKRPKRFFRDLAEMPPDRVDFPVRAFYDVRRLDASRDTAQPLALVLAERIAELGQDDVYRYRPCADLWQWSHPPARIQLKAMARLVDLELGHPVPLYRISPTALERIVEGMLVPRACTRSTPITSPSLEDYGLAPEESVQSKESEELPHVLNYIERCGLAEAARQVARGWSREARRTHAGAATARAKKK
jgi:hypothetical protein